MGYLPLIRAVCWSLWAAQDTDLSLFIQTLILLLPLWLLHMQYFDFVVQY